MSFHRPYSPSLSSLSSESHHTLLYPTPSSSYRSSFAPQEVTGYETIFDELPRYEEIQTREVPPPPYSEIAPDAEFGGYGGGGGGGYAWEEQLYERVVLHPLPEAGPSRYREVYALGPMGGLRGADENASRPIPLSSMGIPPGVHRPRPTLRNLPFRAGSEARPYPPRSRSQSYVLRASDAQLADLERLREDAWGSDSEDGSEYLSSEGGYEDDSEEDGSEEGLSRREQRM
ncbi:hypothetical protein HBH98_191340 [Parastagonospora nodorum]|nr:hypothetical protein HBH52_176690 [Parastagonospora nodorum]KAH4095458.1 hypothetical protein HBH46_168370 [Parastagonospora nodorum]KAH4184002.1 hypothetical protein HBH42_196450 [Parastagonospora nodorum]KAH4340434.1 hypothetical protein HBH98_191340 [Parastagonospora nodorum]KAH4364656.1 hypothetical protein HBH97_177410 [Parastagonospora nodorum]